jgi:hypothetical protein
MRIYNGFMLFIATIVFIVLGVFLILNKAMTDQTTIFLTSPDSFLHTNSGSLLIVGVIFILLGILEIILVVKHLGRVPAVAFSNPLGEVRISYDALEGYVRSLSSEISEIKDARPQIVAGKDGIEIHVRLVVERDINIPEVTSKFQDLVYKYVKDVMGIENIETVKVYIQRISSKKSQVSPKEQIEE